MAKKKGLLDSIYDNIIVENLNKEEVKGYLKYLEEIVPQLTTEEEKLRFLALKVKLDKRMVSIDIDKVNDFNKYTGLNTDTNWIDHPRDFTKRQDNTSEENRKAG